MDKKAKQYVHGSIIRKSVYFGSRTDSISLVATHLVLVLLVGATSSEKSLRLRRFKPDRGEIWQNFPQRNTEYATIEGVGFRIWRHTFKMAAMTSFREKPLARYVWRQSRHCLVVCAAVAYLIHSTFVYCTCNRSVTVWLGGRSVTAQSEVKRLIVVTRVTVVWALSIQDCHLRCMTLDAILIDGVGSL